MTIGFAIGVVLLCCYLAYYAIKHPGGRWSLEAIAIAAIILCGGGAAIGYIIERIAA